MIQYSLKCSNDHQFDSWFQSASAFDKLAGAGMVECSVCGSSKVEKAIMSPRLNQTGNTPAPKPQAQLSEPSGDYEQAVAKLKSEVEKNSDYVGNDFVRQARAMHDGEQPQRAIHGEARGDEARKLLEDGVPVMPLPFTPTRKTN
ncbi:DUF1178 family protein [Pseudoprimorskyibacter insulae]|uniref:Uncharacterized protein n=1 Tax=Pseudoprimorskyibacter insulae TaxID=1695997 RepID=A0A2R8AQV9_9RHOB|nr:DUF1178 family protein [Pseudoprimorskyibacter insulae]SPF78219.1 hypothetical protein PRI8871_00812 [Pseudoprimorskyibacter insulae]